MLRVYRRSRSLDLGPFHSARAFCRFEMNNVTIPNLGFIPIVNLTDGTGLIYAHTVSVQGNRGFLFLEGCFHLITPVGPYGTV